MIIGIASDHRGYDIKKELISYFSDYYKVVDYGTTSNESTDYPIYAFKIGEAIKNNEINLGILICGTGIGMSIACNKVKKVRCAKVSSIEEAKLSKLHNSANVIALSSDINNIKDIVKAFIETPFSNEEKHIRRIEMINDYES